MGICGSSNESSENINLTKRRQNNSNNQKHQKTENNSTNNTSTNNKNITIINNKTIIKKIIKNKKLLEFTEKKIYQDSLINATDDLPYNEIKKKKVEILQNEINLISEKVNDYLNQNIKLNKIKLDEIKNILQNENTISIIKEKIYQKINAYENDNSKHNLEYLKIILVGRKKIGKTDLIKYILKLEENESNYIYKNEDFKEYTSEYVPYLKLVEYKGIGFDKDSKPEIIGRDIFNYIDSLQKKKSNDLIHCIWYCITETKFEAPEIDVLKKLKHAYQNDNVLPVIVVYTRTEINETADKMEQHIKNQNIDTVFIKTSAKDFEMMNGKIIKAFGRKELLEATLEKCTQSLQGELINLMTSKIAENIKNELLDMNKEIKNNIQEKMENKFMENFNVVKNDGELIDYILNILLENLKDFYGKNISNKTFNLLNDSLFIKDIKFLIKNYKSKIKDIINPIIEQKSIEFLDMQAKIEISNGNTNIKHKRTLNDYKKIIEIFLKKNLYYISQKLLIAYIIQEIYTKFFEDYRKELNLILEGLMNINSKNPKDNKEIKSLLEHCFLVKLKDFGIKWDINLNIQNKPLEKSNIDLPDRNDIESRELVKKNNNELNTNSFIFNQDINVIDESNNDIDKFYKNQDDNNNKWFPFEEGKEWKYMKSKEDKELLKKFLQNLEIQDSFFNLKNDDQIFVALKNDLKKDLINFLNQKKGDFMQNIHKIYLKKKFPLDKDIIQKIIEKEKISLIYETRIKNKFDKINNDMNLTNINYMTILVLGRSGIGKSSLINALLKKEVAHNDVGFFCTLNNDSYRGENTFSFLNFIDTRGTQLDEIISLDKIVKNAKEVIDKMKLEAKKNNDYNKNIQCIYYCIKGINFEESEKKAILELKNNKENIPLIVVFTQGIKKDEVNYMKNIIENELKLPFISVLSKKIDLMDSYGLNDLLKMTLNQCQQSIKGNVYRSIENIISQSIKKDLEKINADIKCNINNKLLNKFFDFNKKVNENDLYESIYNYIQIFFIEYMYFENNDDKIELSEESKNDLNKSKIINDYIKSYIDFYQKKSEEMIKPILENKSLEYLDMQAKKEKKLYKSINTENKNDRNGFKKIINDFLCLNFYYISQKYCIYRLILDISEIFSENLEKQMNQIVNTNIQKKVSKDLILDSFNKIFDLFRHGIYQPYPNEIIYQDDNYKDDNYYNAKNNHILEKENNYGCPYPSI